MNNHFPIFVVSFCLCLFAGGETPSARTEQYFKLFKSQKYSEVAKMIAPDELKQFRKGFSFVEAMPDEKAASFLQTFFGPKASKENLKTMSDVDFYSALLSSTLRMMGAVKFESEEILSEKIDGDKVAKVAIKYKISIGGNSEEESETIEYIKVGDKWMMLLPESMKQLPAQLEAAFK